MKSIIITLLTVLVFFNNVNAQKPVEWSFSLSKITSKTYEVALTASIAEGWHIYAQKQPKNFIGVPVTISFIENPSLKLINKPKEIGKLEKKEISGLNIEQYQYMGKVSFTQTISLKTAVNTLIKGKVFWQACTDQKCLLAQSQDFVLNIP